MPRKIKEEKRIYIIVPETVDILVNKKPTRIKMVSGRLMAQCSHVGRKLENQYFDDGCDNPYREITTIVLGVRNSKELHKINNDLYSKMIDLLCDMTLHAQFYDKNKELYHTKDGILTAIAVGPIKKSEIESIIGHLDLYV